MDTFWEITAIIMLISLSLYLRNWLTVSRSINRYEISAKTPKIINMPSDQSMPPILHQTAGVIFFITSCVAFAIKPSSLIVRAIGIFCMNATTFLPFYVHHRLFRKGQNSHHTTIVLILTIIITIITITLDYLRGENSFLDGFKQRGNELYYAYYFTGIMIPLVLNTMTTILFYQNIYQYRDGLSIVRRTIGFTAFFSAAISDIILLINLFLSFWGNTLSWLDTIFSILLPLLALLLTLYVLPRRYYQKIAKYIDMRLRQEEQEAREYLHSRWIRVVPAASGYDFSDLDPKIIDAEIEHARYIAWTYKPTNRLITPAMDAQLLFELLSKGSSLYKIGPAEPRSPRDDDVNKHNIAVMHILKRKESLISVIRVQ